MKNPTLYVILASQCDWDRYQKVVFYFGLDEVRIKDRDSLRDNAVEEVIIEDIFPSKHVAPCPEIE